MQLPNDKLAEILVKGSYLGSDAAKEALKVSAEKKLDLSSYLLDQGQLTKDLLGQAIAEYYKFPYADLNSNQPSRELVLKIPEEIARKYQLVVFTETEKELMIATAEPELLSKIRIVTSQLFPKQKLKFYYSLPEDIAENLLHYRKSLGTRFVKIIEEQNRVAPEIIVEILQDAISFRASDIHFEPQETEVVLRFRIDGILQEAGRIPKDVYENILNRIKVEARMRIDEHFAAQDGAIRVKLGQQTTDLRVSIVPTLEGQKVVIRILSEYVRNFTLGDLGLAEQDQELVLAAVGKPFGMVLTSGPTGSGKTTTMYSVLKLLHKPQVNITTIEDPVEYKVAGINQIQVNPQTNLTFAEGLKSIVRQDPNIILVGEIRDQETAEIAINAALTGHLMLSTFHAIDAAATVPRLLDMGIESFLLASTLNLIVSQRLVRKVCESCRVSREIDFSELDKIMPNAKKALGKQLSKEYFGKGCSACNGTGYRGRSAIFEILEITKELQELIVKNPSAQEIAVLAKKQGARDFFADGIEKVKNGNTTVAEVLRVAPIKVL